MLNAVQRARARRRQRAPPRELTELEIVRQASLEAARVDQARKVMAWYDEQPEDYREVLRATPDNAFGAKMYRAGVRRFEEAERIMQQAMEQTRELQERQERRKAMGLGPKGQAKVARTMREFAAGKLHSGSKEGPKVTKPAQAKAIAMSQGKKESRK